MSKWTGDIRSWPKDNPVDQLKSLIQQAADQVDNAELEGFEQGYAAALAILAIDRDIGVDPDPAAVWAHKVARRRRRLVNPNAFRR